MLHGVFRNGLKKVRNSVLLMLFVLFFVAPAAVFAQPADSGLADAAGLEDTAVTENINLPTQTPLVLFIARAINVVLGLIGIIMLGLIIYGGWLYMTSQGNPDQIGQAKKIWKNAVIGLLIVLSSFAIVNFILRALFQDGVGGGVPREPGVDVGVGALGDGLIESHYPERGQRDVPRNVSIIITFKEALDPASICEDSDEDGDCDLKKNAIAIFPTTAGNELYTGDGNDLAQANDDSKTVAATVSTSGDKRTFVITPANYLGNSATSTWYGVRIFGDELLKANGEAAKLGFGSIDYYQWKFEVSTRLDLEPPYVSSIFPAADNGADDAEEVKGAQRANGTITINTNPLPKGERRVTQTLTFPDSGSGATFADGSAYNCSESGAVTYKYQTGVTTTNGGTPTDALTLQTGTVNGFVSVAPVVQGVAGVGCGLRVSIGSLSVDKQVTITVAPSVPADTVTIANARFDFGTHVELTGKNEGGATVPLTAAQIAEKLADSITRRLSSVEALAKPGENVINISALEAGEQGNAITLETSDPSSVTILGDSKNNEIENDQVVRTTLKDGSDQKTVAVVTSRADEPRNAVIQVNFNETMNPLMIGGPTYVGDTPQTVASTLEVRCFQTGEAGENKCDVTDDTYTCNNGAATCLKGEWLVSNLYRTAEFRTTTECGQNTCGETMYCLPKNARIEVHAKTAALQSCGAFGTNEACTGPAGGQGRFEQCRADNDDRTDACFDNDDTDRHFPTAGNIAAPGGIVDIAFNSLDGNKNFDAQGPISAFRENDLYGTCTSKTTPATTLVCTDATTDACAGSGRCLDETDTDVRSLDTIKGEGGDNYQWSFWVSDKIETTSPPLASIMHPGVNSLVDPTGAGKQVSGAATTGAIRATFDRLMMSASLKPGYNYPNDFYPVEGTEQPRNREYLAYVNFTARELGYWVKKEDNATPNGTAASQTTAIIEHTPLAESEAYGFVAGSGLKDVYQNCYNPANDTGITGSVCQNLATGISCCKGEKKSDDPRDVCYEF